MLAGSMILATLFTSPPWIPMAAPIRLSHFPTLVASYTTLGNAVVIRDSCDMAQSLFTKI